MLRPRKRVTKREIKEDALVTFYVRSQKFIKKYKKQATITLFGLVVITLFAIWMTGAKKKAGVEADEKIGIEEYHINLIAYGRVGIDESLVSQIPDLSTIVENLHEIVNTYPGTKEVGLATYLLANSYYRIGDYERAKNYYEIYIKKYTKNDLFSISCMAGIAACLESQEQYDEAASMYESAGKKYADSFPAPFYLKDAGRCYAQVGNKVKAREMYNLIKERYPKSSVIQDIPFLVELL
jgi:TolA-binding protein